MTSFLVNLAEISLSMSAVILLLALLLRFAGGKFTALCRYILWTLVLVRLAVPVGAVFLPALIEVPVPTAETVILGAETDAPPPETGTDTAGLPETAAPRAPETTSAPFAEHVPETVMPVPESRAPVTAAPAETSAVTAAPDTVPPQTDGVRDPAPAAPVTIAQIMTAAAAVYFAGAAIWLLWHLLSYGHFTASVRRSARDADGDLRTLYEEICRAKKVRRVPRLVISPQVASPCAFGWFSPCIAIPETRLSGDVLAGTLLHEITHCRRGDLYIKLLALLVRALHWFNPIVHYAAVRCETEMELSCDEAVLRGCSDAVRADYGEVMLEIVRRCRSGRGTLTTHFNPRRRAVRLRFRNILYGSGSRRGLPLIALCLVICLLAGTIVACRVETPGEDGQTDDTPEALPMPEDAAGQAQALTAQIVDYLMTEDWLTEGYRFTELDANRLIFSLTAVREMENHPCSGLLSLSEDGRFARLSMADAADIVYGVLGYEDWSYTPPSQYEPVQREESTQTYRIALETGLWTGPFSFTDVTAEAENGCVLVRGTLKNSDRYEYAEKIYGTCTFTWQYEQRSSTAALRLTDVSLTPPDTHAWKLNWREAEASGSVVAEEIFELPSETVLGLASEFPHASPIAVDGRTVFAVRTADGYAVGWAEGEYPAGTLPADRMHWFSTVAVYEEGVQLSSIELRSWTDALDRTVFTLAYVYTSNNGNVYFFDDDGTLMKLNAPSSFMLAEVDFDDDGDGELLTNLDGTMNCWDLRDGTLYRLEMDEVTKQLQAVYGQSAGISWDTEEECFTVWYSVAGQSGRVRRNAVIRGDEFRIIQPEDSWSVLAQDESGTVTLSVPGDGTESFSDRFRIQLHGYTAEASLSGQAWLRYSYAPQILCTDMTGDGTSDAMVIFATGTGTGVHVEEAVLVDGANGALYAVPKAHTAVEERRALDGEGNPVIRTDDGRTTAVSEDAYFTMYVRYYVENGTLFARVPIGYGMLSYVEDVYFVVEYRWHAGSMDIFAVTQYSETGSGALAIDVRKVPIVAYGTGTVLGEADVTLCYNEAICDTRAEDISASAGLQDIRVIRSDQTEFEGITVTQQEIFNWFYSGYARVYDLSRTESFAKEDGYHFATTRYLHGMTGDALAAYGEETDERYRARREYMYMLQLDTNTWLCLTYLADGSAPAPNEAAHYNKVAARVEVPQIVYNFDLYSPYILDVFISELSKMDRASVSIEEGMLYPDRDGIQSILSAMQYQKWKPLDKTGTYALTSRYTLSLWSGFYLSATDDENVMAILQSSKNSVCAFFSVPDGVSAALRQLAKEEIERKQEKREANLASIQSFLPENAEKQLVMHKIFLSNDYLLAYRGKSREPILWRADDTAMDYSLTGDVKFTQIHLDIPDTYEYEYAEVVGITGGGGSGEYCLYVALYSGSETQYLLYYSAFREQPRLDMDALAWLTPEQLLSAAGAYAVFPNRNMPHAIDDMAEWDFPGITGEEDIRSFLSAFLIGDTATVEQLCGVPAGMYDSWKGMHFGDWVVYLTDENGGTELRISFILTQSESEAFPTAGIYTCTVQMGMNGVFIRQPEYSYNWVNSRAPVSALRQLLAAVTTPVFPTTDTMTDGVRWQITGYLCYALGNKVHPVSDVKALAEEIFGIKDFTPHQIHVNWGKELKTADMPEGDYCAIPPHDGTSIEYEVTGCEEVDDKAYVTVQFYADPSHTVKAELMKYELQRLESNRYRVVSCMIVEDSPWSLRDRGE